MTKLICCLQFFEDDKPQAMRLAKMIADIEMQRRDDVEFMFVRRFDAMQDMETLEYVAQKFLVSSLRTTTQWTGWPGGCNGMAMDLLNESMRRAQEGLWGLDAGLLMIEPDCVPTCRDWLNRLIAAWDVAKKDGAWIMGAWRDSGGEHGHINGNCIVRPDFGWIAESDKIMQHLAWDCALNTDRVREHWCKTSIIRNCFRSLHASEADFYPDSIGVVTPALIHGFKDDSAYLMARERMDLL